MYVAFLGMNYTENLAKCKLLAHCYTIKSNYIFCNLLHLTKTEDFIESIITPILSFQNTKSFL